ncbi:hypothetical protein QUB75_01260 [Microcoleus sp. K1-B6]|uniref:hypothetical protein n=1 Tax=unclassified Microcoleus TaxID=2642155 RepID=UPI002FD25CA8
MSNFFTPEFNNESAIAPWNASLEPTKAIIPQLDANRVLTGGVGEEVNIPTLTPEAYDNIILPDAALTQMANGAIADSNSSLPDSSVDLLTGHAMSEVYGNLSKFAAAPDFVAKMNLAFGENWDAAGAKALAEGWFQGDFSDIPPVNVVSSAEIAGANGAFAEATDTIYLSQEFLAGNAANPAAVADVLLEEIGHSVDSRLNVTDSPGDEGAIFGAIVQGKELSEGELQGLKSEDDRGIATIDSKILSVEYATFHGINFSQDWGGLTFDWSSGEIVYKQWAPFTRNDENAASYKNVISRNWGNGAPSNVGVGSDKFGVFLWREADFEEGVTYNFSVKADDYYNIRAIPFNANSGDEWINISGQNGNWLKDAYDRKTYTFNPAKTGKYWVNVGYAEEKGDASFSLSWDSNKDITVENETFPVKLSLYENGVKGKAERSNIDPNKDTVVVIHGRGGGGDDDNLTIDLAKTAAESQYYPNSQVLYLDWKDAANDPGQPVTGIPFDAAERISPVAQWATNRLKELGIAPEKTILLGHSLGSYVASEIGRISGGVKNLVALDPAFPGNRYDIDGNHPGDQRVVDFNKAATNSIALVVSDADTVGGAAGDNEKATSANDSYIVNFIGYEEYGGALEKAKNKGTDYHNGVVNVFSNIMSRDFTFPSLLDFNRFDYSGKVPSQFVFERAHEGVITAALTNGVNVNGLDYIDSNGKSQVTWNS